MSLFISAKPVGASVHSKCASRPQPSSDKHTHRFASVFHVRIIPAMALDEGAAGAAGAAIPRE